MTILGGVDMGKWKARLCTTLFIIVLGVALTASFYVKSRYGFSLYDVIISTIAYLWIGECIEKFYKWLIK